MSSENNAPPTITPRLTVPRPDTDTTSRAGGATTASKHAESNGASNGSASGAVPPPPPPPPPSQTGGQAAPQRGVDDDGMERASGESRVAVARAGAVKAAAAAIAAAKSAAKKVSAAVPAAPAETGPQQPGHDEIDDETVRRVPTTTSTVPSASAAASASAPAPAAVHYSAAGVSGSATPLTGATPAVGPATGATPTVRNEGGPRRVRLAVSRIDPWSAMKLGFLLAVAIGIMTVVATAVVWYVLDGMMVFAKIEDLFTQIVGTETDVDIQQYVAFGRVISIATLLGVVNVVIITALSTIMAFLYNIVAALVGGVHLTLTDD
ncbi:hypothetical protein JOE63_000298 [Cellulosimicrobium cellulans]|jgi:hypothetical protein|uniref:DUF3566 domain-containing protein n=1 Tax=Cellulosimicrobium cellulans TaxID=1710 RepID=UPI0019582C64|nr:DUF3566 domain-containing protein [Cellulosimicrobium cellulans]MBM7817821.1 hypothetical protein [Cellulosimicrobium cellulans]